MRLAALETSTSLASVALFEKGELIAEESMRAAGGSGEALVPMLSALFSRVSWSASDVSRWAVGIGPGSFSGTRVAVATAKGIVLATGAELVGVTSLDALAEGAQTEEGSPRLVVSVLDAGRGEVFLQARRGSVLSLAPSHLPLALVADRVSAVAGDERPLFVGEAALALATSLAAGATFLTEAPHDLPRAAAVGRIALRRPAEGADVLEPLYVRPPEITSPRGPLARSAGGSAPEKARVP